MAVLARSAAAKIVVFMVCAPWSRWLTEYHPYAPGQGRLAFAEGRVLLPDDIRPRHLGPIGVGLVGQIGRFHRGPGLDRHPLPHREQRHVERPHGLAPKWNSFSALLIASRSAF